MLYKNEIEISTKIFFTKEEFDVIVKTCKTSNNIKVKKYMEKWKSFFEVPYQDVFFSEKEMFTYSKEELQTLILAFENSFEEEEMKVLKKLETIMVNMETIEKEQNKLFTAHTLK